MSAPALRRPARPLSVARACLAASAPAALLGIATIAVLTLPGAKNVTGSRDVPFVEMSESIVLMLFLPLLHWRGRGGRRALDEGLPMREARQEWMRAACGALWAAATLGAVLAIHLLWDTELRTGAVTFHPGLPVSIFGAGLGMYLLGTAVLMRTDRPGRVLLLTLLAVGVLGALGEPLTRSLVTTRSVTEYAAQHPHVRVPGWERTTLLALALGVGAVWASTLLARHGGVFAGLRGRWTRAARRVPLAPRTQGARAATGPRRASSFGRAVARQFVALRSRLGWSTLILVSLYAVVFLRLPDAASSEVEMSLAVAATFWPALVWMEERSRRRDWDESLPVGRLPLRVAHALAGAAWLMIAAAAGAPLHPAGPALPAAALVLYLASTAGAALLGRPVLACFILMIGGSIASIELAPEHPLSLARAHAPLDVPQAITWSPAASLVWIALLGAAAVAALHLQARRDRLGAAWLPRLRRRPQPA